MDDLLKKFIDFISLRQNNVKKDEKSSWENNWIKMIQYYKENKEIFEIDNKWDFYCNEALHNHYNSIVKSFKNLSCIEYGCGGGYESALMAKEGAIVTVLDYSKKALEYAKIVSRRLGVIDKIKFIYKDIFNFNPNNSYDLAWSCGVIEHYKDNVIISMIKKMASSVKEGGLVIITVPNLLSPQSIYWMIRGGKGSERYLSHKKLMVLIKKAGLKEVKITSLNYWLPSFLPYDWAIKTSRFKIISNLKCLAWLFSGVGVKSNKT